MSTPGRTVDQPNWEELRSAWSLYVSAVEVWMEAATTKPTGADVDHLIHAVMSAHNSWSDAFMRVIQATHHH
jgi:hypothetical protein